MPDGGTYGDLEHALIADLTAKTRAYEGHMEAMDVRKAAQELRGIWVAGNEYLQTAAPWTTFKTDPEQAAAQIRLALNLIPFYAVLSAPFIPDAANTMMAAMGADNHGWPDDVPATLGALKPGHSFTVPDNVFSKISDEDRESWQERFAGTRD